METAQTEATPDAAAPKGITAASIDPDEIARFSAMAEDWWNPHGKFKPLHAFNPTRLAFIRDRACAHFGRSPQTPRPLSGLRLLDIGCGGGLLAEPMCRLGASVTAIDASDRNVKTAALHGEQGGLTIDYRVASVENLAAESDRFDIVLNMEVVEHVADLDGFLAASAHLVKPRGLMLVATLNRTVKSLALAKIGAEYILRWLPAGTHDWRKFVQPAELCRHLTGQGLTVEEIAGVRYNPLNGQWSLGRDLDVNYMVLASKPDTA